MNLEEEFKKYKKDLGEAKVKRAVPTSQTGARPPVFQFCDLWEETFSEKKKLPGLVEAVANFIKAKSENPLLPYGKSDRGFTNPSIFPDIKHAHITQDICVFYKLEGANPRVFKMYGVFTHAESGTGNKQNRNIQVSLTKTMKNQVFTSDNT